MTIKLYMQPGSAASRAAWMTLKHLHQPVKLEIIDVYSGEHLKNKEFLKMNPCHTIPVIDDDGYILFESRAVMLYLAEKYGGTNDRGLYPKDPKKRGEILKMLFFDVCTLYPAIGTSFLYPQLMHKQPPTEEQYKELEEKLGILNGMLTKHVYAAANHITLADLSILSSVSFLAVVNYQFDQFPRIRTWLRKLQNELPYFLECSEEVFRWRDKIMAEKE